MIENGVHNFDFGADRFGFRDLQAIHWNFGAPQLYEHALQRTRRKSPPGPAGRRYGRPYGRSPKDKFIVRDATTEGVVWWDNNNAMTAEHFDVLLADFIAHAKGKTCSLRTSTRGADPRIRLRPASSPNMPGIRCSSATC